MAENNFEYVTKYADVIDELYTADSKTAVLDSQSGSLVSAITGAREVKIPKVEVGQLGDYDRDGTGYVTRGGSVVYETMKLDYDRGAVFSVDAMDNEETGGVAFGMIAKTVEDTAATPELDAYRFASYASATGITTIEQYFGDKNEALSKDYSGDNAVTDYLLASIRDAVTVLDENMVSEKNRYLFITPTLHNLLLTLETYKSQAVFAQFDKVIRVPQQIFYTGIELLDGTSDNEKAGGYKKASKGKDINFMIIQKDAVFQFVKHLVRKPLDPNQNQIADSWKYFYRVYAGQHVYENKAKGIYVSYAYE